ncbi:MAG: MCE family protein [Blastocatellia bacterium]|nr:MCE family protein [Blastocatellia bacterium]
MSTPTGNLKKRINESQKQSERKTVSMIVIIALIGLAYFLSVGLSKPFILKAKFSFGDGLKPGAEVDYAGVKIGRVRDIKFLGVPSSKGAAEVFEIEMELDEKVNGKPTGETIRKDAKAALITTGALGDRSIDIFPGTPSAEPTKDGDYIGSYIEPNISTLVNDSEVFQNNMERVRQILEQRSKYIEDRHGNVGKFQTNELNKKIEELMLETNKLDKLMVTRKGTFGRLKQDQRVRENLKRILDGAEKLRASLQKDGGAVGKLMRDEEIRERVEKLQKRIEVLSDRTDKIVEKATKGNNSLAKFTSNTHFRDEVKRLRTSVGNISEFLEKRRGTAGLLIYDTRFQENTNEISAELLRLVYDIKQKPRKYVKFTIF